MIKEESSLKVFHHLSTGVLIRNAAGDTLFCNQAMSKFFQSDVAAIMNCRGDEILRLGLVKNSCFEVAVRTKREIVYEQKNASGTRMLNHTIPVLTDQGSLQYILEEYYDLESLRFYLSPDAASPGGKPSALPETGGASECVQFKSPEMQKLYKTADQMALHDVNILILGQSGTGKSQLAKRIHEKSRRRKHPFITINCSTLPPTLIESELFGYTKGAFSGASSGGKQGLVDLANHGTLFLDEIGELPLSVQAKLLQFTQAKSYLPVGGTEIKHVDTRIIAATNQDLSILVSKGKFREDLYYRLATVSVQIPPLAERRQDILALIRHFSCRFNQKYDLQVTFANVAIQILAGYHWPGNIRELEHTIEFLMLNSRENHVTPDMLPEKIRTESAAAEATENGPDFFESSLVASFAKVTSLQEYLEDQEKQLIQTLYGEYPNSYKLADRLKISQSTASRLIRKYIHRGHDDS